MEIVRLMLVDDHDVVRTGLRSFLEGQPGLEVVAEARDGQEALALAPASRPDVVLMDITMPTMDGLEATRRMKGVCPSAAVLALSVHDDKQYFMQMLAAGASGYLTKQAAADELVAAIRMVAAGTIYLQPALARWLLEDYQRLASKFGSAAEDQPSAGTPADLEVLSARERQVLEMVADGLSNQAIAERLTLSPKTIARHRERIMGKLNLHSRTELVKFAIRTGVIALG